MGPGRSPVTPRDGHRKRHAGSSSQGEPAFTTFHMGMQTCVDYVW